MRDVAGATRRTVATGAYVCTAVVAWLLLLDFGKKPLVADTDPSWMAALTYAAAHALQFGRDIVYTYGPLAHLVSSTYSAKLFWPDFALELLLKGIAIAALFLFAQRLSAVRRVCFLITIVAAALISYQTLYLFGLLIVGFFAAQNDTHWSSFVAGALFAAVVALIKFTFLWFVLLMWVVTSVQLLIARRFARAAIWTATLWLTLAGVWVAAGQQFSGFFEFLRGGAYVTAGYSDTMGIAANSVTLLLGVLAAFLVAVELLLPLVGRKMLLCDAARTGYLSAAVFLAWKVGFVRADAHTAEFFYFAVPMAIAAPAFAANPRTQLRIPSVEAILTAAVFLISVFAINREEPGIGQSIIGVLRARCGNLQILCAPDAARRNEATDYDQQAQALQLPNAAKVIGDATVDVLGNEQAAAVANRFNYAPNPTVQSYCTFTPALAKKVMAFYRSTRAPQFVLYKLQPIDDRVPTIDNPDLIVHLLQNYEPLLVERGYVLMQKRAAPSNSSIEPTQLSTGSSRIGHTIDVPPGLVWAQLQLRERRVSRVLSALYHSPEVLLELTTEDGRTIQRRLLTGIASSGFMINPMPWYETDVIGIAAGQMPPPVRVRAIRVVPTDAVARSFKAQLDWRFSRLPDLPPPKEAVVKLYERYRGFADVLNSHATSITSALPLLRFRVAGTEFLLVHPVGETRFEVPPGAQRATGEFAIHPDAYNAGFIDGVTFEVEIRNSDGSSQTLFHKVLQPRTRVADRDVQRFDVALPQNDGGTLILHTFPPPSGVVEWAWGGWANIRFNPAPNE